MKGFHLVKKIGFDKKEKALNEEEIKQKIDSQKIKFRNITIRSVLKAIKYEYKNQIFMHSFSILFRRWQEKSLVKTIII